MEEHPVIEREHTRVHEENKTEASKVRWVQLVGPDDMGGPAGRRWGWQDKDGDSRTMMGMDPDITPPSKVQRPDAPTVKGEVLVGECGGTRRLTA